jgi:hypothetical protein
MTEPKHNIIWKISTRQQTFVPCPPPTSKNVCTKGKANPLLDVEHNPVTVKITEAPSKNWASTLPLDISTQ